MMMMIFYISKLYTWLVGLRATTNPPPIHMGEESVSSMAMTMMIKNNNNNEKRLLVSKLLTAGQLRMST